MTNTKSLSEIRHLLVVAAQKDYDDRIARGIHPYAMASYHFNKSISEELAKHVDISNLKADNYKALNEAYDPADYPDTYRNKYRELVGPYGNGLWAVSAYLSSSQAYATPGFFEAYQNHCRENN